MIIWSGKGFFTIVILLICMVTNQELYKAFTGLPYAEHNHSLLWASVFSLASLGNYFLSRYIQSKPTRTLIDKETGEEFNHSDSASLFFIPVRWWTHLFAIIAVIFLINLFWSM